MYHSSFYKGCLVAVTVLLLLIIFCLFNVETGTAPYYLTIFSFIIDVPFFIFLLYKIKKAQKEESTEHQ
jgi:hypothetical protein